MPIPLVDLKAQYATIRDEIAVAIQRILDNTSFVGGKEVETFEQNFAAYCGAEHAIGVSSGTSAIHLALEACGVGQGDEVIVPAHTFIATIAPIVECGAQPVFVDMDPATYNIDPNLIEDAITERTQAIMPVHLYGQPADMTPILEIAKRHNLRVIEDSAQAHGARYSGQRVGSMGDIACFSFYPGKNLGAYGDGGIVTTNSADMIERVRLLRDHGRVSKYAHASLGYNYRLDALQAAILDVKLKHLDDWNAGRRRAAAQYDEVLGALPVETPAVGEGYEHVFHLYVIQTDQRDDLLAHLHEHGVGAGIHYPIPNHLQEALAYMGHKEGDFPHTEAAAKRILSLPIYGELSADQVNEVAAAVRAFFELG